MLNIVLSGGPASGKSTSLAKLERELSEKLGVKVLIVPETATELIANGIAPGGDISLDEFQEILIEKQLQKEKLYQDVVNRFFDPNKTVILYDRGLLDSLAYCSKEKFIEILSKHNLTMADAMNRYDAVIHLVTSAKGTDCYTTANNVARRETAEEAIIADEKTLAGNMYHPHVRVVDNSTNFEQKIQRVLSILFDMLNAPLNPSEIERKFLIKKPSQELLDYLDYSSKSDIIQTYLSVVEEGVERRVRQRGTEKDGYTFYYTEKTPISNLERVEKEKKISMRQYVSYLTEADTSLHQIKKTRYCFMYENQYFELDIYPESMSTEYAIVEIELGNVKDEVKLPDFLDIIKEVTDDIRYKNHSLAKTLSLNVEEEKTKEILEDWTYETGREECEILGSGSHTYSVFISKDKDEVFAESKKCARNYIRRRRKVNGKTIIQEWIANEQIWIE